MAVGPPGAPGRQARPLGPLPLETPAVPAASPRPPMAQGPRGAPGGGSLRPDKAGKAARTLVFQARLGDPVFLGAPAGNHGAWPTSKAFRGDGLAKQSKGHGSAGDAWKDRHLAARGLPEKPAPLGGSGMPPTPRMPWPPRGDTSRGPGRPRGRPGGGLGPGRDTGSIVM
jgi:hypothetical protein